MDFVHALGGERAALSTVSKLERNRKGKTIATLKNGVRILITEPLPEAQRILDRYKITAYALDDNDLGGPFGEQLIDEHGKPVC